LRAIYSPFRQSQNSNFRIRTRVVRGRESARDRHRIFKICFSQWEFKPMANMNFRGSFPFDEPSSSYPAAGGLPALLQEAMRQQGFQSALLAPDNPWQALQPSTAPEPQGLPASLRQGSLTRLLSSGSTDGDTSSRRDPNFRQLVSRPSGIPARQKASDEAGQLERFALNAHPVELNKNSDGGYQSPPDGGAEAANLVPVGFAPSIRVPGLPLGPQLWPQTRDEDIAEMWKAMKNAWANFTYGRYTGHGASKRKEEAAEGECEERERDETAHCYKHKSDVAHPDYFHGCMARAKTRADMCRRNGGTPRTDEPPEWKDPDEETWRNYGR
jgi:hypothetical protein